MQPNVKPQLTSQPMVQSNAWRRQPLLDCPRASRRRRLPLTPRTGDYDQCWSGSRHCPGLLAALRE
eukprot:1217554-Prorocentrum_lima.AAC.1